MSIPMLQIDGIEEEKLDARKNDAVLNMMVKEWNLGPEQASEMPDANSEDWTKMGEVWQMEPEMARRRVCANCEYFDNTPERMEWMESVPFNKYDADGGGRGYCHEFKFICHNLRTCQAWERKEYIKEID